MPIWDSRRRALFRAAMQPPGSHSPIAFAILPTPFSPVKTFLSLLNCAQGAHALGSNWPLEAVCGKSAGPREASLERPTLECNAGNIDAFQGRKATVVLWRTWRWSALDHSSALCPSTIRSVASHRDLAFAGPHNVTARRGQPSRTWRPTYQCGIHRRATSPRRTRQPSPCLTIWRASH
jgi:hypothetical protein